jgi:hypothetical protein
LIAMTVIAIKKITSGMELDSRSVDMGSKHRGDIGPSPARWAASKQFECSYHAITAQNKRCLKTTMQDAARPAAFARDPRPDMHTLQRAGAVLECPEKSNFTDDAWRLGDAYRRQDINQMSVAVTLHVKSAPAVRPSSGELQQERSINLPSPIFLLRFYIDH